jgi:hypothetical protein
MRFPTPEITSSFRVRAVATIAARYGRSDRNRGPTAAEMRDDLSPV